MPEDDVPLVAVPAADARFEVCACGLDVLSAQIDKGPDHALPLLLALAGERLDPRHTQSDWNRRNHQHVCRFRRIGHHVCPELLGGLVAVCVLGDPEAAATERAEDNPEFFEDWTAGKLTDQFS